MALLLFLCLYHLLLLVPNLATSKCPESFQCGDHFPLRFPFTDIQNPGCGLFTVDGCNYGNPTFLFGNSRYHTLEKISTNKFKVFDTFLGDRLNERECFASINVSLPKSPSISFTIPSNLTLFACFNRTSDQHIQDYFRNYHSYYDNQGCGFPPPTVYYLYPTTDVTATEESNIPTDCGVIQLPIDPNKGNSSELLDLLTAEFTLEWTVSEDCYQCYQGGGQCLLSSRNEFHCEKGSQEWSNSNERQG